MNKIKSSIPLPVQISDHEKLNSWFDMLNSLLPSGYDYVASGEKSCFHKDLLLLLTDLGDTILDCIRSGQIKTLRHLTLLGSLNDLEKKELLAVKITTAIRKDLSRFVYLSERTRWGPDPRSREVREKKSRLLSRILSICYLGKRLTLSGTGKCAEEATFQKWNAVREKNLSFSSSDIDSRYLLLGTILLSDLKISHSVPFPLFSNGSVAGCKGIVNHWQKYNAMCNLPYLQHWYPDVSLGCRAFEYEPISELIFVPKGVQSKRPICKESPSKNFLQRSFEMDLEDYIKSHSILSSIITLDDQDRSRLNTLIASCSGLYSTIDLSSASDSVLIDHIYPILPDCAKEIYLASRTDYIEFKGTSHRIRSSSPQGSCVNFPLESICFTVYLLIEILTYEFPGWDNGIDLIDWEYFPPFVKQDIIKRVHNNLDKIIKGYSLLSVYGDDIICPHSVTRDLLDTLKRNNFIVNDDKSFTGVFPLNNFRESCGMFSLDGVEVPIVMLSRNFHTLYPGKHRDKRVRFIINDNLIQLYNSIPRYFSNTRNIIIKNIDFNLKPVFSKNTAGIHTDTPSNKYITEGQVEYAETIDMLSTIEKVPDEFRYFCTLAGMVTSSMNEPYLISRNKYRLGKLKLPIVSLVNRGS